MECLDATMPGLPAHLLLSSATAQREALVSAWRPGHLTYVPALLRAPSAEPGYHTCVYCRVTAQAATQSC